MKITWHEAMDRFGVDKPDLRFGMELTELTDVFAATEFKAFAGAASIKGINAAGKAEEYGRNKLDGLTDRAKQLGAKGLVWLKVAADGALESPVAKFLSDDEQAAVKQRLAAQPGDLILIVADEWATTCEVLGQLRNDLGRPPVHEGPYRYVWVVDFPMFVGVDEAPGARSPVTTRSRSRIPTTSHLLETDPMAVRSQAYDLVLNGWELGSGSIRIHEPELQTQDLRPARHHRRGGRPQVRVLPQPVPVRRAAARRIRVRHRPAGGDPGRGGEHPRGDRLPEDPVRRRSDDQRAHAGRRRSSSTSSASASCPIVLARRAIGRRV